MNSWKHLTQVKSTDKPKSLVNLTKIFVTQIQMTQTNSNVTQTSQETPHYISYRRVESKCDTLVANPNSVQTILLRRI